MLPRIMKEHLYIMLKSVRNVLVNMEDLSFKLFKNQVGFYTFYRRSTIDDVHQLIIDYKC